MEIQVNWCEIHCQFERGKCYTIENKICPYSNFNHLLLSNLTLYRKYHRTKCLLCFFCLFVIYRSHILHRATRVSVETTGNGSIGQWMPITIKSSRDDSKLILQIKMNFSGCSGSQKKSEQMILIALKVVRTEKIKALNAYKKHV